jgi:hypothetical protein
MQADLFMLSFVHRYTARPEPSVRNDPTEPEWVVITVPVVDALAGLLLAGLLLAGLPLAGAPAAGAPAALLHAATNSAPDSGTPSLTGTGSRFSNDLLIIIVSPVVR